MRLAQQRFLFRYLVGLFLAALWTPTVAITPIEVQKLLAQDGAEMDDFGASIALDGDTAVIGAPYEDDGDAYLNNGAAYIFTRSGAVWVQQRKLLASDKASGALFGFSVAIDGDTVIIGAKNANANSTSNSGAVYVFNRSGDLWIQQAKLMASDKASGDWFGSSVAIDGDRVIIGAPLEDDGGADGNGAAYIFTRSGTVWAEQAKLLASDRATADYFGYSVSIDGDTAVVGALSSDIGGSYNIGAAYVFIRAGNIWTEQAKLVPSDIKGRAEFGRSVAIGDDTIVIGSPRASDTGVSEHGAAYVFTRAAGSWTEQAKLLASDKSEYEWFGQSVALQDDTVVIGADLDSDNFQKGASYVFTRFDTVWTEQTKLLASDAADFENFGRSVAMDGDFIVVGAPNDDDNGTGSGSAYVFDVRMQVIDIDIDIKPGSSRNPINLKSRGNIPVAILTTNTFDALQVDWESVRFGPSEATEKHQRLHVKDADYDGDMDVVLHFKTRGTGILCGDTEATLTGETFSGEQFSGSDVIKIVKCPKNKKNTKKKRH